MTFLTDENGRKFSKQEENTVERREIARFKQFLLFPQCSQETYGADTQGLFVKGLKTSRKFEINILGYIRDIIIMSIVKCQKFFGQP